MPCSSPMCKSSGECMLWNNSRSNVCNMTGTNGLSRGIKRNFPSWLSYWASLFPNPWLAKLKSRETVQSEHRFTQLRPEAVFFKWCEMARNSSFLCIVSSIYDPFKPICGLTVPGSHATPDHAQHMTLIQQQPNKLIHYPRRHMHWPGDSVVLTEQCQYASPGFYTYKGVVGSKIRTLVSQKITLSCIDLRESARRAKVWSSDPGGEGVMCKT